MNKKELIKVIASRIESGAIETDLDAEDLAGFVIELREWNGYGDDDDFKEWLIDNERTGSDEVEQMVENQDLIVELCNEFDEVEND